MRRPEDDEDINITDETTGETRVGKRRKWGFQRMKNGRASNDYIQGAIRKFDLIKAGAAAVGAVGGVVAGVIVFLWVYLLLPQMTKDVKEIITANDAAIVESVDENADHIARLSAQYNEHILAVATKAREYPTRDELTENTRQIQHSIDLLRDELKAEREERRRGLH